MNAHDAAITLAIAVAAGVFLIALAERLRVPSIALLLLGGVVLGPELLGLIDPGAIGSGLETVVTLTVAIILFEGGLTLDVAGFWREPKVIVRMLTLGVLVTWAGIAATVYLVFDGIGIELAIIGGSLVIVTGPTVVSPLLRRIGVQPRLHHILYWEGVLVDAVGVFVAVLCYEWIITASDEGVLAPLGKFVLRFAVGTGIGIAAGGLLGFAMRRGWVPSRHINIVVLGTALIALAASNAVLYESGILAAIVAGFVVNVQSVPEFKALKRFKLELTEIGIGLLFILLAAKLELASFVEVGGQLLVVLAVVLLVIRPINVLVSTWGQNFDWRERAFLSWLAPRGIVAASMASLFSLRLSHQGYEGAALLETITYAVIGTTVVVQGLSAPWVARLLGLQRRPRGLWLLIGQPDVAVALHRQLRQAGGRSIVISTAEHGDGDVDLDDGTVQAIATDPLDPTAIRDPRLADLEAVLACAREPELNEQICAAWESVVGAAACYRWASSAVESDGDEAHGVPLWTDAPLPGDVSTGMKAGTYAIEALEVGAPEDAERFGSALRPLLSVEDGRIAAVVDEIDADARSVVALRHRISGLYGLVEDAIVIDRHAKKFEDVVAALLELAARAIPELPADTHLAEILDREKTMPTVIGSGVAVPHVYDDRCPRSTCYVANAVGGLELAGPDHEPVELVFLIVSPSGKAQEHLRSLAAIAQLASDVSLLRVLTRQRTRGRLLTLLRERA